MKQQGGNIAIGAIGVLLLILVVVVYLWSANHQQNTALLSDNASLQESLKNYQAQAIEHIQALKGEESESFRLKHLLQKATDENQNIKQQLAEIQARNNELASTHSSLEEQLSSHQQSFEQQHQALLQEQQAAFATEKQQWLDDQQVIAKKVSQLETELKHAQDLAVKRQQDWDNNKRQTEAEMQSLQKQNDALISENDTLTGDKKTLSAEKQAVVEQQQ